MSETNALLTAALDYAKRGWRVLPLNWITDTSACSCGRADCSSPGKHPFARLCANGSTGATVDVRMIRDWWTTFPRLNVGIATGEGSGIVVLDVDPRHDGTESLAGLIERYGDIRGTLTAKTGSGGLHFFFRHPGFAVRNSAGQIGPGVDVRGEGGYVVAAPSNHASGGVYEWANDADLGSLPAWIASREDNPAAGNAGGPSVPREIGDRIPKGSQHATLVSLAGSMRRRGSSADAIFAALDVERLRCEDVPPSSHMRRIADTVARYAPAEAFDAAAELDEAPEGEGLDHVGDALVALHARLERAVAEGGMMGLPTGIDALDDMTGGVHAGELTVIAARPSMGKSAMARTLAVNQARLCGEGEGIATFSVEMSRDAYLLQMLGAVGPVDGFRFRKGRATERDLDEASKAAGILDALPLYLNARAGITVPQIAAMCRAREAAGVKLRAVYVDYLQLVRASSPDGRRFNREDESLAVVSMGLKALAKDLDTAVVALVQLNRKAEDRKDHTPQLSDLRGSGQIEQDADVALFIHRPERAGQTHINVGLQTVETDSLAIVNVAKQRMGPVGEVFVHFDKARTLFGDLDKNALTHGRAVASGLVALRDANPALSFTDAPF